MENNTFNNFLNLTQTIFEEYENIPENEKVSIHDFIVDALN